MATVREIAMFSAAVAGAPFGLGLIITALFVAGRSFLGLLVPLLTTPAVLMVLVLGLACVMVLVLGVQGRWTRPEIALGCTAAFAGVLWLVPLMLIGDLGAGFVLGFVLVVLALAFGPLPVCFWVAWRMTGAMHLENADPDAPSWLCDATEWVVERIPPLRERLRADQAILEPLERREERA